MAKMCLYLSFMCAGMDMSILQEISSKTKTRSDEVIKKLKKSKECQSDHGLNLLPVNAVSPQSTYKASTTLSHQATSSIRVYTQSNPTAYKEREEMEGQDEEKKDREEGWEL
ncbi:hypothetical protein Tco_0168896 [Tanacetum coccineum]